ERVLTDRRTTFAVVTTLEAAPVAEAEFFTDALARSGHHVGAVVLNRTLPGYLRDEPLAPTSDSLQERSAEIASSLFDDDATARIAARVLREVGANYRNLELVARREAEHRRRIGRDAELVAEVPWFAEDITDLRGLARIGDELRSSTTT
ncbi:MAG: hypothetical protein AAGF02_13620, partial [Actinomycetota bacterium]